MKRSNPVLYEAIVEERGNRGKMTMLIGYKQRVSEVAETEVLQAKSWFLFYLSGCKES